MARTHAALIEAANARLIIDGDLDAIADFFASDYVAHVTGKDLFGGHKVVKEVVRAYRRAFSEIEVKIEILVKGKHRSAWQRTLTAKHTGPFKGFPATKQDPRRRPHPAFVKPGDGWGLNVKNSWVDVRNTENLFLMRVTSVYLMAEETGHEETRKKYKELILKYAAALYRVGMGEWDSENYHGHSLAPLLNLFDFAKDKEIKAAAKACLDYRCAIGAVKYCRGAFNGPTNRD